MGYNSKKQGTGSNEEFEAFLSEENKYTSPLDVLAATFDDIQSPSSSISNKRSAEDFNYVDGSDEKYYIDYEGENLFIDSTDWRKSHLLKGQVFSGFYMFVLVGLCDQAIGTLIPEFQSHYEINDIQISMLYFAAILGYMIMAFLNQVSHNSLGFKGVMTLGSASMTFCCLILSFKPSYPLFVMVYVFNGIGVGLLDASFNFMLGGLVDSNELLGILHGCYGLGCLISPVLITSLLQKQTGPWSWNQVYMLLCTYGAIGTILIIILFRDETVKKYRYVLMVKNNKSAKLAISKNNDLEMNNFDVHSDNESIDENSINSDLATMTQSLKSKLIWVFAMSLMIYVGGETAFGAWLITFLMRIKKFAYKHSSYMATSFWLGLTTGRMTLGFVTSKYFKNELLANMVYVAWSAAGFLIFWLLAFLSTDYILFAVVFLTGLGVGPIFPTTIVTALKILPAKYHTAGVGFICAFGGSGGAIIPFLVGLIADTSSFGLRIFPLMILSMFIILSAIWGGLFKRYASKF